MKGKKATFENFIPGEENRVTFLAAQRIAHSEPGSLFNPFYIYGGIGIGKTHLLEAIYNEMKDKSPQINVLLEKSGNIVEELKTTNFEEIVRRITNTTILIIDDIHHLTQLDKDQVNNFEQKLLNMFNQDIQLIFSALYPPRELQLGERMISIIESGLVCALAPPKEITRLEILKKMYENKGVILSDEIIGELARIPFKSVRELEGALNRVLAYSSIGDVAVDRNLLMMALKEYYQEQHTEPVVSSFLEEVSAEVDKAISEVDSEESLRKQFKEKVYIWGMKGFQTDRIENLLNQDIESLKNGYEEFVSCIEQLVDLQREYGTIDLSGRPEIALKIEELLFDPDKIEELRKLIEEAKGIKPAIRFEFSFEDMIIGDSNCIAVELAKKAIVDLGQGINPLTLVGKSGTGKTSLLWAVGNDLVTRNPMLQIEYLNFQHPVNEIPKADVLLIDNLEKIGDELRSDFLNTIKAMIEDGKQIFITSEVPPLRYEWLGDKRRIFEEGVEAELSAPDQKMAIEYIKSKGGEPPATTPPFESFYELDKYTKFEEQPIPLGLPGEEDLEEIKPIDTDRIIFPSDLDDYLLIEELEWQ